VFLFKKKQKPIVVGDTKDVVSNADFYFSILNHESKEIWKRVHVSRMRVRPDDPIFAGNLGIIALGCSNYQGLNNGCRGHTAMVYKYKRWCLFFVWLLDPEFVHGYEVIHLT
jgi:hypothetical protein